MKKIYSFLVFLMLCTLVFGQANRSDGNVIGNFNSITPGQQFSGQEIFRFQPGLVTQLAAGSTAFDFSNSQWFSIGNLNTALLDPPFQGTNEVFGLRFQLPNKSLIYGYQDLDDDNPRVQWIDDRSEPGDLEFRFADSFSSTNSTLVASMTNEGQFILPPNNNPFFQIPSNDKLSVANRNFRNGINVTTTDLNGAGMYLYSLFAQGEEVITKRMLLK